MPLFCLLGCVATLCAPSGSDCGEVRRHWLPQGRLVHLLRVAELPSKGVAQLKTAFLDSGDASKALETLYTDPSDAGKQLRKLASGVSLQPRQKEKDVQAKGRLALIWWDTTCKSFRRSSDVRKNTFDPDSDRLEAALAILDSAAIAAGKSVKGEQPTVALPARWLKAKAHGGFAVPKRLVVGGQAITPAFAGISLTKAGNFTPEHGIWNWGRGAYEDKIREWIADNLNDKVAVLMVFQYPNKTSRVPSGFRCYAVSASGSLQVQLTAFTTRDGKQGMMADLAKGLE